MMHARPLAMSQSNGPQERIHDANVRCRCGATYRADTFERLALVETLDASALGGIVLRWPSGQVVSVRACSACGAGLARLSRP